MVLLNWEVVYWCYCFLDGIDGDKFYYLLDLFCVQLTCLRHLMWSYFCGFAWWFVDIMIEGSLAIVLVPGWV